MRQLPISLALVSLALPSFSMAEGASQKVAIKIVTGREILAVYASICDDLSWKAIKSWSDRNHFEQATIRETELEVSPGVVKAQSIQATLELKIEGAKLRLPHRTYSGTPCSIAAQLTQMPLNTKALLLESLFPRALAEDPTHEVDPPTTLETVGVFAGMVAAGAASGCAMGAQLGTVAGAAGGPAAPATVPVGMAAGCLSGVGLGALAGAGAGVTSLLALPALREKQREHYRKDLEKFFVESLPQVTTCSREFTHLKSGEWTMAWNKKVGEIEMRKDGQLKYRTKPRDFAENPLLPSCESSADIPAINAEYRRVRENRSVRLAPSSDEHGAPIGSVRSAR